MARVQVSIVSDENPNGGRGGCVGGRGSCAASSGGGCAPKKVPELRLLIDETGAQAEKVERILGEIAAGDGARAETAATEGAEDDDVEP